MSSSMIRPSFSHWLSVVNDQTYHVNCVRCAGITRTHVYRRGSSVVGVGVVLTTNVNGCRLTSPGGGENAPGFLCVLDWWLIQAGDGRRRDAAVSVRCLMSTSGSGENTALVSVVSEKDSKAQRICILLNSYLVNYSLQ